MKKKVNFARVIWVVSLFLLLIIILLMVMDYKINYQYLKHNYLYFYECKGNLCVSEVKDNQKLLFSSFDCGYEECPEYKKSISETFAVLEYNKENILYNYKEGTIVSNLYDNYEMLDNKAIIVEKNKQYGIINLENKEIVKPIYDEIGIYHNQYLIGYNLNNIIVKKNNKYGIISYKDGNLVEEFKYTEENLEELIAIIKKGE